VIVDAGLVAVAATVTEVVPSGAANARVDKTLEPFTVRAESVVSDESGNGYEVFQDPLTLVYIAVTATHEPFTFTY
jgi:hypothetical protein